MLTTGGANLNSGRLRASFVQWTEAFGSDKSFPLPSLPSPVLWPFQISRTSHTSSLARWLQPSSDVVRQFHSFLYLPISRQIRKTRSGAGRCTAGGVFKHFIVPDPDSWALLRVCWGNAAVFAGRLWADYNFQALFAVLNQAETWCFQRMQVEVRCALHPLPMCQRVPPVNKREEKEGKKEHASWEESGECLPYMWIPRDPTLSGIYLPLYFILLYFGIVSGDCYNW